MYGWQSVDCCLLTFDNKMNKARRNTLRDIAEQLESLCEDLEAVASEERECYDNLPESLQESERGCAIEEAADELDDIFSELDELLQRISDVADNY